MSETRKDPAAGPYLGAYLALTAERLLARFWPALSLLGFVGALAFSGFAPRLGFYLHALVLAVGGVGLVAALIWGARGLLLPTRDQVLRRLERASALPHRPLAALEDANTVGDDPVSAGLWRLHQQRMAQAVRRLRVGAVDAELTRRDGYALRVMSGVLFIIAVLAAGTAAPDRLAAFFLPTAVDGADLRQRVTLDAWITPPDYTGAAPVFLTTLETGGAPPVPGVAFVASEDGAPPRVAVPAGSALTVQVGGVAGAPTLAGTNPLEFASEALGQDGHRLTVTLSDSDMLRVVADDVEIAVWDLTVTPDAPPTATLAENALGETLRNSRELRYAAEDDYGLEQVEIRIVLQDPPEGAENEPIVIDLPTAHRVGEPFSEGEHFLNQVEHIWAGEPVFATLHARDALGQEGESAPVDMTLPARDFNHPVAIEIIRLRKQLALQGAPAAERTARDLRRLGLDKDAYLGDVTVFLGLTMTARRLLHKGGEEQTRTAAVDLLWALALRLEDGDLSIAERRLREAERALMEALNNGASDEEIDRLMQELQQAMNDYLQALAESAMEQFQNGEIPEAPFDDDARQIAQQDINEIMERIREMLQSGMRDAARRMLEQLQRMMENMQAGVQTRPSPEGMEAMEMLEGLQELMRGQRELLDRTFERAQQGRQQGQQGQQGRQFGQQQGQQGQQGQGQRGQQGQAGQGSADAALQEALRRQLGDIMQRFGEMMGDVPAPFGQAEQEMRGSTGALRDGRPGEAVPPQGRALDQLQEAARQAQQSFMERFGNQLGQGPQGLGQGEEMGREDPFGRAPNEATPGQADGDVAIPDVGDLQRAREIRDELRRRSGDQSRPDKELDYIDRLLKQFN
ncbi:MAG: TIGR02302 family protein [Alphaproteobacteria bacterium]|nr:TIGR02302 family protein [Alphaproteobacteria bacterium]